MTGLRVAVEAYAAGGLSDLERDGLIQRFEYTWEFGWKTMRDYLLDNGISIPVRTVPNVIRAAFQAGLIDDGDAWIKAKNDRNIVSHEYGLAQAERIAGDIHSTYLPLLDSLAVVMGNERRSGN